MRSEHFGQDVNRGLMLLMLAVFRDPLGYDKARLHSQNVGHSRADTIPAVGIAKLIN